MVEKKFYLTSESENLQRIGLRAQIISYLIENGIERGNAVNDTENKRKVIVVVDFDSKPSAPEIAVKEIEKIRDEIVRHLNSLAAEDSEFYGQVPTDIEGSELHELSNPLSSLRTAALANCESCKPQFARHAIAALDLQKVSAALMLDQTGKGVGVMIRLTKTLEPLSTLSEKLEPLSTLSESINKLRETIEKKIN